jgi:uncharacterized protein
MQTPTIVWPLLLVLIVPAVRVEAASFNCAKAQTPVERLICSDPQVSELDDRLDKAYRAAEVTGTWQRSELGPDQREWLKNVRNRCNDAPCLVRAYQVRIEELSKPRDVTGTYKTEGGLLKVKHFPAERRIQFEVQASNGMNVGELAGEAELRGGEANYPTDEERVRRAREHQDEDCKLRVEFPRGSAIMMQRGGCGMGLNVTASGTYSLVSRDVPVFESTPAPAGTPPKTEAAADPAKQKPKNLDGVVARHAKQIARLGFAPQFLKSVIYLQQDLYNRPQAFVTFEQWLALLFENESISKLTAVESGSSRGIVLKSPGVESHGFLFKFDDGDLFPTHFVKGDQVMPIEDAEDAYAVAAAIAKVAADAVK